MKNAAKTWGVWAVLGLASTVCGQPSGCHEARSKYAQIIVSYSGFGPVRVGRKATWVVAVENVGDAGTSKFAVNSPTAPFAFDGGTYPGTGGTCGASLAANASCRIVLSFSPTEEKVYEGSFQVVYAPPQLEELSEDTAQGYLHGSGVTGSIAFAISPEAPYEFGSISIGSSKSAVFMVTNATGLSQAMTCSEFSNPICPVSGSPTDLFCRSGGTCCSVSSLAPGGTCTVEVKVSPSAPFVRTMFVQGSLNYGATTPPSLSNWVQLMGTVVQ